MRTFLLSVVSAALLSLSFLGGPAGCGGNPPDVAGSYALTSTECPGFFNDDIEVTQSGGDVTIDPTGQDLTGKIEDNGDFTVSNADGSCDGHFDNGVATASCENTGGDQCDITYEKQ